MVDPVFARTLVEKLPAMFAYWDARLRCQFANPAYETWFGVNAESMIGRDMREFLGPLYELNRPYIEGALRGEAQVFEREIPDPRGGPPRHSQAEYIPDIVDGVVRGFCVLVVDISRRKHAEEALREVERRMHATDRAAALATLAAGISHEINNPLSTVLANLELARQMIDEDRIDRGELSAMLADNVASWQRIASIVHGMRLLARGGRAVDAQVDVRATLEESLAVVTSTIRYHAALVRELDDVGAIQGDPAQLAQVFVALLMNAAQALPEDRAASNEIRVRARRVGPEVVIEIVDNGVGMPAAILSRIFEPFFTTRPVGQGAGLGLSIASTIVATLGGTISVDSTPGAGSVFRVTLPAVAASAKPATPAAVAAPVSQRPRVLVVDDEARFARSLARALGRRYDVEVVHGGHDALAALSRGGVDVIVSDLMMPDLMGSELYAEVAQRWPELADRFVVMTGGAFTEAGREFLATTTVPVLEKPFSIEALTALIDARVQ